MPTITKDTAISLSVAAMLAGGIWWAATVQSDITYTKRDVAEIKQDVSVIREKLFPPKVAESD